MIRPFGARVIAVSRSARDYDEAHEVEPITNLQLVLKRADMICKKLGLYTRNRGTAL
ncbi:phosphoglycerate dehydrogenase-like enzyme [Bradyrhizobium sp. LB1.3]